MAIPLAVPASEKSSLSINANVPVSSTNIQVTGVDE